MTNVLNTNQYAQRTFVAFTDTRPPRAGLLKKGFRHCDIFLYCPVIKGHIWLERTRDALRATALPNTACVDYPEREFRETYKVGEHVPWVILPVSGVYHEQTNMFPLSLFTCVGMVKRFLGIRNPFIITPYQLYKYLNEQEVKRALVRDSKGVGLRYEKVHNLSTV